MRRLLTLTIISLVFLCNPFPSVANWHQEPYNITFVKSNKEQRNYLRQQQLRESDAWKNFASKHGTWNVLFDERTGAPHRAYGAGFVLPGSDATDRANKFIATELISFSVAPEQLVLRKSFSSAKYQYVDYFQTYDGLEILNSRVTVRTTLDNRLVLFGADVFNDIQISVTPQISEAAISNYAISGMTYQINGYITNPELKILPVPVEGKYEYHLVYEVTVEATDFDGYPARYYTLVDAHDGVVMYRQNEIASLNDELTVQANVSDPNPFEPEVLHNLPSLRVKIDGTDYYTDGNGNLDLSGITLPATATIYLQGQWSKAVSGNSSNTVASFTQSLDAGSNIASFDGSATLEAISGYYHANVIHDFMKTYLTDYTEMDEPLVTRVERTDGSCNAYYDGSSINFYTQGGGCFDLALTGDVVYHEYGHGIDMRFHDLYGNGLSSGALNEGYSDVWGIGVTDYPIIGIGISTSDPNAYVRRYDINKKVYPQDILGEAHSDGEIICGCWYDTRLNIGSMDEMMKLFSEALYGLADGFDGQEGTIFTDVLIDALTADDDNGNINDGTPHDIEILNAFALHGITLIGNIEFEHTEPLNAPALAPVTIETNIDMDYPIYFGEADLFYKLNTETTYDSVTMTLVNGALYQAQLPAQQPGSILDYYFKVRDIFGAAALTEPAGISGDDPNLPYKLLIGYEPLIEEDLEYYAGDWNLGDVNDDATTGQWVMDAPIASYLTVGVPSSQVQTGFDHTPTNSMNICAFTGNANLTDGAGTNDVDRGRVTMYSPKYDLTEYQDPAITYYRWFSNDQGATPGNDPWRVYITNGDGTWVTVENTHTADHSWRANAFRVSDFVDITDKVQLKFIASDSVISILDLEGQSLVEAALDDLFVWDLAPETGVEETLSGQTVNAYPNPADDMLVVQFGEAAPKHATIRIVNALGQVMQTLPATFVDSRIIIHTASFEPGAYSLDIITDAGVSSMKFMVQH